MLTPVRKILTIVLLGYLVLPVVAQNWCQGPCVHRMHPYDVVPCSHVCYGPYGAFVCHPAGDAVPCVHPVHPYDLYPC
jgi:hypothetical protein